MGIEKYAGAIILGGILGFEGFQYITMSPEQKSIFNDHFVGWLAVAAFIVLLVIKENAKWRWK